LSRPPATTVVAGDEALATFRQGLTGPHALELLDQARGRLLVQLAVGAGKTEWLIHTVVHAVAAGRHGLVLVLVPRRDILQELVGRLPAGLDYLILKPRPRRRCGALDAEWQQYEQKSCGALGREQLCRGCPRRRGCPWPGQYGERLRGARLILATQQHLALNPQFILHLCRHARAQNPLVLIDESNLLLRSSERTVLRQELEQFIGALEGTPAGKPGGPRQRWLDLSRLVAEAATPDLRGGGWRCPSVGGGWAREVQRRGRKLFGPSFRFLGYELHHFARSDPASRERLSSGDLRFAALPYLGRQFIVYSGSIAKGLARYRLDPNHDRAALASPFEHHRFEHPGTRWYNLNTLDGSAHYFPGNASRILDFFAAKIARNIRDGKRTLLVSKKRFVPLCREYLSKRLEALGAGPVTVATGHWGQHDLADPRTLALIHYGVAGLNCFQHCEAAYCLNSFYVNEAAVAQAAQDIDPAGDRFPIRLCFTGAPRQRRALVEDPRARETILPGIVQGVLDQKEADAVVQAVGRVRPFTRPREVITFHAGDLPGVRYTLQFDSLGRARNYFGIQTARKARASSGAEKAWQLKALGWSRVKIVEALGVSLFTVKRYIRQGGVMKPYSN
jgi:hypothetical protein